MQDLKVRIGTKAGGMVVSQNLSTLNQLKNKNSAEGYVALWYIGRVKDFVTNLSKIGMAMVQNWQSQQSKKNKSKSPNNAAATELIQWFLLCKSKEPFTYGPIWDGSLCKAL